MKDFIFINSSAISLQLALDQLSKEIKVRCKDRDGTVVNIFTSNSIVQTIEHPQGVVIVHVVAHLVFENEVKKEDLIFE